MQSPSRFEKLGIRQTIKRGWLDFTLSCVCDGRSEVETRERLLHELEMAETANGKIGIAQYPKIIAMLAAWFAPKDHLDIFVGQLVEQAKQMDESKWVPLHWAVLAASYPFFLLTTIVVGRLLALQDTVSKAQILRRIEEVHGTAGMVERNLRYALMILVDLGMLRLTEKNGVYRRAPLIVIEDDRVGLLLWKAVLHGTKGGRATLTAVRNSPAFFAFSMPILYSSQFREVFDDVDTMQYAGVDEQLFIKEEHGE